MVPAGLRRFGIKVGSSDCNEGQIFIEPQGMCIMAGIGVEDGLAEKALLSVASRLATPHGILLHQPAYSHYYLEPWRDFVLSAGI